MEIGPKSPPLPVRKRAGFYEDFRRFFVRGLATLLPTLITILLLFKAWEILWEYLGKHIIWFFNEVIYKLGPASDRPGLHQFGINSWQEQTLGVLLAIVVVYIVGLFVGNLL